MKLESVIIGILLVSAVVIGLTTITADMSENYGVESDTDEFEGTYNKIDEMSNLTKDMEGVIKGSDLESSNVIYTMSKGAWSAMLMIFQSFGVFSNMIIDSADFLGWPAWLVSVIISIFLITIVFLIIKAIMRVQ